LKEIWRFPLKNNDTVLLMPKDAEILCLKLKDDVPCIWAVFTKGDEDEPVSRRFVIKGTGHPIDEPNLSYIGTYMQSSSVGTLVCHVFEMID